MGLIVNCEFAVICLIYSVVFHLTTMAVKKNLKRWHVLKFCKLLPYYCQHALKTVSHRNVLTIYGGLLSMIWCIIVSLRSWRDFI